jgi:hypothetical protein
MVTGTVIFFLCSISSADVPDSINYQGKLTTASGGCLNGTVQMTFTIYADESGTVSEWSETQTQVEVKEGIFNVLLGSVNPVPDTVFDGNVKYLGVQVESDPEMSPLKPMVSVGYAFRSAESDTADFSLSGAPDDDWDIDTAGFNVYRLTGNVGIGTPSPGEKLEVVGNVHASGSITSGTSLTIDGTNDKITATSGTIDFDDENLVTTGKATIGPGHTNAGFYAFAAGQNNTTAGWNPTVGGGRDNMAGGDGSTVGGGVDDTASGTFSTVGGGAVNVARGQHSTAGGGNVNLASGNYSTVSGGAYGTASGNCSTVPGGLSNTASGYYSFAAGMRAKANHHGTFVWADSTGPDFASTGSNQFLIRASGGVGIGTTSPSAKLEVAGDIKSSGKVVGKSGLEVMVPKGAIIMWSGTINGDGNPVVDGTPDTNWQICDGTGGTPNLSGRFVVATGTHGSYTYNVNDTNVGGEGEEKHTLTTAEMPSHTHKVTKSDYCPSGGTGDEIDPWDAAQGGYLTSPTGGSQSHENRPPYYALAFIMRVQ